MKEKKKGDTYKNFQIFRVIKGNAIKQWLHAMWDRKAESQKNKKSN